MIEIVNYIYNELKYTPQYVYNILIFEIIFIVLYFVYPMMKDEIALFNPFSDKVGLDVQKAELRAIDQEKLLIIKDIKTEKEKLTSNYPSLNDVNFFNKIKENSLLIEENNEELENHIISYICPACGPNPRDKSKPIADRENYKTLNTTKIEEIKNILKYNEEEEEDGIIAKIAKMEARLVNLDDKRINLEKDIKEGTGSLDTKIVQRKPLYLGKKIQIANYQDLRKGGKLVLDDLRYNYGLSFWFYLHSNAPNFYIKKTKGGRDDVGDYEILNYSDKPKISYNPSTNKLIIKMNDNRSGNDGEVSVYEIKDIKLQKWNNLVINYVNGALDIFLDTKLVGTIPWTAASNVADNLSIGDDNGLNGGICNVIFYGSRLTKKKIEINYELLKNKNPPIL